MKTSFKRKKSRDAISAVIQNLMSIKSCEIFGIPELYFELSALVKLIGFLVVKGKVILNNQ